MLGTVSQQASFRGIDGKPGTPDKWPNPICTWQRSITKKIQVVTNEQPVISMVTDEGLNPSKTATFKITEALMRPSSRGAGEIALEWKPTGTCPVPISAHVMIYAGDQVIQGGALWYESDGHSSSWVPSTTAIVKQPLAPDIRMIDIVLDPDPKPLESEPEVNRVWGKPIRINNVPLERFDLKKPPSGLGD